MRNPPLTLLLSTHNRLWTLLQASPHTLRLTLFPSTHNFLWMLRLASLHSPLQQTWTSLQPQRWIHNSLQWTHSWSSLQALGCYCSCLKGCLHSLQWSHIPSWSHIL